MSPTRPGLLHWHLRNTGIRPMSTEQELSREIAALEHELRRVRDGLERNPSHRLERRARQLRDNIDLCRRQLAELAPPVRTRSSRE